MPSFPDILDPALRQRLCSLGVRPEDVEERFVRGTGPGGQKINKTSSTVWLRHGPTGVEVRCQDGRSQVWNRAQAWAELGAKLANRRAVAAANIQHERQAEKRRRRQKSYGQKVKMIEGKKHRAKIKQNRGRPESW
jgi:protein subunit release factor B